MTAYSQRPPSYSPREMAAIVAADRVVARVLVDGQWREAEFPPLPEEAGSVRAALARVVHSLRHTRDSSGVVLYVEGPSGGGRCRAAMPRDPLLVPTELR